MIYIILLILIFIGLKLHKTEEKIKQLKEENAKLQWEKWDKEASTWENDLPEKPILSECKHLTKIKEALKKHNKRS